MADSESQTTPKRAARWRVRDALKPPFSLDLVWVLLPFSLVLLCFGMLPLRSWDYWWHITMGRLIHQAHAIPAASHYLYTMPPDTPSFVQPWMSQWLLYGLHDIGGLQLVLLVRNLVAASAAALLGFGAMRRSRSAMHGAILTLLSFALAFPYISARPNLFAIPLFGLLIWLGYRVRRGRFPLATVLLFPAITALWANLHGSFFIPAAIAFAFGTAALCERFDPRKTAPETAVKWPQGAAAKRHALAWFGTLALSLAAPLLNPRGAELYGYVWDLSRNAEIQNTVIEWMPTTFSNPPGIGLVFYLALLVGGLVFWRRRQTLDPVDLFLFAGFALLTIFAARGMLWFALIGPCVFAGYLSASEQAPAAEVPPGWMRAVNLLIGVGLLMTALILQPGTIFHRDFLKAYPAIPTRDEAPLSGLVLAETPVMSTAILQQHPGPPHLFHDQKYAGYLIYHLNPSRPAQTVFVDQRIELPTPEIWELYYQASDTSAWKGIFQQYAISAAVLNKDEQPILIRNMRADPGWEIRNETAYDVLFIQKN